MKGEYLKEKDNQSSMFAKLHQTQKFPPPPPSATATANLLLHHHNNNPYQVASAAAAAANNPRECQTSEEVDSHRSPGSTARELSIQQPMHLPAVGSSGNDGASIEVVRRPRGRPPGSKNKPKPTVVITRDSEPSMTPYVLELPAGVDIVESITSFCRKRNMGLCILNGSGTVANVTLREPSTTQVESATFHGIFEILSLSATVIPQNANTLGSIALSNGIAHGFTISLAGSEGHIIGGAVVGSLFTAGTVYLIAASFNNPSYCRLPLEDDRQRNSGSTGVGGSGAQEGHQPSPSAVSGGGDDRRSPAAPTSTGMESRGVPMYSCQLPSDVIWAPIARQPPQRPPPY